VLPYPVTMHGVCSWRQCGHEMVASDTGLLQPSHGRVVSAWDWGSGEKERQRDERQERDGESEK
jgi:hypothetical protein